MPVIECNKRPSYNIKGSPANYCTTHKKANMINVTQKLCAYQDCKERARYNYTYLVKSEEYDRQKFQGTFGNLISF